ncbi:MAG: HTH domain-containing protein [Oculatellaceae cyanobacterium Prado106]|jgi:biotin operon repressor|nr:HTH domain-containing protein [Oculatellaceae cyanobacterium Prado106]
MNKTSTDKIRSAALFLIRFRRCLPQSVQSFVRPYLDQPYQLALKILDCCSATQATTLGEIAQQAGVTRETVRQVLLALKEGGISFKDTSRRGWLLLEEIAGEIAEEIAGEMTGKMTGGMGKEKLSMMMMTSEISPMLNLAVFADESKFNEGSGFDQVSGFDKAPDCLANAPEAIAVHPNSFHA